MKKIALVAICLLCSIVLQAQDIEGFVHRQLQTYPQSRLLDLYKSCFQDYMQAQDIEGFVHRQLQTYPQSRLLDLYKSCFQDYMGAEHLVSDRPKVKAASKREESKTSFDSPEREQARTKFKSYLDEELSTTTLDDLMPWNYEPCGIDSNYYRVSIRTIKENVISEEMLLDAFELLSCQHQNHQGECHIRGNASRCICP